LPPYYFFGINYFTQRSRYVTTNNAAVGAPLISVPSLAAGQVVDIKVNIGDRVTQQQVVAEVANPRFSDSGSRQGLSANSRQQRFG